MRPNAKRKRPAGPSSAPKPLLSGAERAELQRQGAKAAARGDASDTNPLGLSRNRPLATGEAADKWLQRSDAWTQGHDAQSSAQQGGAQPLAPGDGDEQR